MTLGWQDIRVEEGAQSRTACDCCRTSTVQVEGDLFAPEGWLAFYSVGFSEGHADRPASFQIGTGDWSEGIDVGARWLFWAEYLVATEGFRLVDPPRDLGHRATCLNRSDIIGSVFAEEAFAMLDAIYMNDSRLEALRP